MAITKPPVLPAWADAGDKVQPSNAELSVGWPVSSTPPSRQRFNWVLNFVANAVRYFSRRGMPDYDAAETYMTGDRVIGDDGKTYRSLVDNNTAQTPSTSPAKWERWGFSQSDLGANAQTQPYTAFTTTGATGAFVLTPSPALTAYAANQRFRVKFHVAGNGSDTINVSGLGTKSIKQYDRAGSKVAAVITAGQLADVEYDGVDFVVLDPLPSVGGQQLFTAGGNFTVPAGVSRLFVSLVGGGGGGAGSISGAPYTGGGGGSGGVKYRVPLAVTPGQVVAVTIGTGGAGGIGSAAGGTYSNSNGSSGGTSSFGALLSAPGGGGGSCQAAHSNGGGAGTGDFAGYGGNGSSFSGVSGANEVPGGGGGNIFSAPALAGHGSWPGTLYGGGGGGGRASGYWANGNAGASGICIVEW